MEKLFDLHIHSSLSDGEGSIPQIIKVAKDKGLDFIAITDHFDPLDKEHRNLSYDFIIKHYQEGRKLSDSSLKVFFGIETNLLYKDFHLLESLREEIDLIILSPHYIPNLPEDFLIKIKGDFFNEEYWEKYKEWVLKLLDNPYGNIAGHIEGYLPLNPLLNSPTTFEERRSLEKEIAKRFFDRDWYEKVFSLLEKNNIALEIHNPSKSPRVEVLKIALDYKIKFSLGSDAHSLDWIGKLDYAFYLLKEAKIPKEKLINKNDLKRRRFI